MIFLDGLWSIELNMDKIGVIEKGVIAINGKRVLGGDARLSYTGYLNNEDNNVHLCFDVKNQNKQEDKIWAGSGITFNKCVQIDLFGQVSETDIVELKGTFNELPTLNVTAKLTKLANS